MKVIYCFVFFFAAAINVTFGQTNCDPEIQYTVKEKSNASYSITLTSKTSLVNAEFVLQDLFSGKSIQTKVMSVTSRGIEIFNGLKPSRYVIYIRQTGCKRPKSVGGKEGIIVGNIE